MGAQVFKFDPKGKKTRASTPEIKPVISNEAAKAFGLKMPSHANNEDGESLWLLSYSDMMTLLFGFMAFLLSFSKIDVEAFDRVRKETTLTFGGEYQKPFQDLKEKLKDQMKNQGLTDKALFDDSEKGMTITFRGSVFFDSGASDLKPEAVDTLSKLIEVVKKQNAAFNVVVEGHTDDNPVQSEKFPSNWELSSGRAAAVLRLFEQKGFPRSRLRAIGYSDTLPAVPNRSKDGQVLPENQSQNRRIVIKLIRVSAKNETNKEPQPTAAP